MPIGPWDAFVNPQAPPAAPGFNPATGEMTSGVMPGAALDMPAGLLDQQGLLALLQQMQTGKPSEEALKSARTQGLLQAALGVLGHSYSRRGEGVADIAQGLGQGLTGYQEDLTRQKAEMLQRYQYAGLAQQLQQKIALQAAVKAAQGGDPTAVANLKTLYAQFDPKEAAKQALAPPKTTAVGAGGSLLGPQGQVLGMAPDKSKLLSPEEFAQAEALRIAGRNNIRITQQPIFQQETAESKAVGGFYGKDYAAIQQQGRTAQANEANYQRLGALLEEAGTGKTRPAGAEMAAYAKSVLGIDLDKNLPAAQAATAISNGMALSLRNTASGAGMPGSMSDSDRAYLLAQMASLEKDPGANKLIIDYHTRIAQREQKVAQMARDYRKENLHIDEGFYQKLQDYTEKNPLFPEKQESLAVRKFNPATGRIE